MPDSKPVLLYVSQIQPEVLPCREGIAIFIFVFIVEDSRCVYANGDGASGVESGLDLLPCYFALLSSELFFELYSRSGASERNP